jgi:hypothetical protein
MFGHERVILAADNKLEAIRIVSPDPIAISLVNGRGTVVVYYQLKKAVDDPKSIKISVTDAGPVASVEFRSSPAEQNGALWSVRITVDVKASLRVGDAFTGRLVFQHGDLVDDFPLTVTENSGASFTVDPTKYDVCVNCDHPPVFTVRVNNTGSIPITRLKVSSLTIEDPANHVRVVYPPGDDGDGDGHESGHSATHAQGKRTAPPGNPVGTAETTSSADVVELGPGDESSAVSIAPGGSLTIHLNLALPREAGTYTGTIQISANGSESKPLQLTLRARGPNGWWWCPIILFIIILVAGATAAKILEGFYGSGGGVITARALSSLEVSRGMLAALGQWLTVFRVQAPGALPRMEAAVETDLEELEDVAADRGRKPGDLEAFAAAMVERVAKRRALKKFALQANGDAATLKRLDFDSTDLDLKAYEIALQAALAGLVSESTEFSPVRSKVITRRAWYARLRLWVMPRLRYIVWMIVVFGTAYTMFYANRCSFGTLIDYLTVFLWSLGLTQAGYAVIGEAKSNYVPPDGS